MRSLRPADLLPILKKAISDANILLDPKTVDGLRTMRNEESSELGLYVLDELLENAEIASEERLPLCQDTGVSIFYVKWGQKCLLEGEKGLQEVLDQAVREAYEESLLRKSILKDPLFERVNTGDNTPSVVHVEMVPGDRVQITFVAKGAGADNSSQMTMLIPADGVEGVKDFVLKVCREAGASSCPPWILGIGIGGTFDTVGALAKEALLRELGTKHEIPKYAELEKALLEEINALGIGPQGLGGKTTALGVFIEARSCHAGSLPVAVNIQCHSNRKMTIEI